MEPLSAEFLRHLADLVKSEREPRTMHLSEEYRRNLRLLEDAPCNQPLQDKSWVWDVEEADREWFASVEPHEP